MIEVPLTVNLFIEVTSKVTKKVLDDHHINSWI